MQKLLKYNFQGVLALWPGLSEKECQSNKTSPYLTSETIAYSRNEYDSLEILSAVTV